MAAKISECENRCSDGIGEFLASLPAWEETLRSCGLPVYLYGTGDGADKILDHMLRHQIVPAGVFASDGFVRDRTFRGYQVQSLRSVEEKEGRIAAVVCFGMDGEAAFSVCDAIAEKHLVLAPSAPVFGTLFCGKEYYTDHAGQVERVDKWLSDEQSRKLYRRVVAWQITGDYRYLACGEKTDILPHPYYEHAKTHIDVGAYDGDTANEYLQGNALVGKIIAYEPDRNTFRQLLKNVNPEKVECICTACSDIDGAAGFRGKHGRGGHLDSENGNDEIPVRKLDTLLGYPFVGSEGEPVGSIKIDAEGMDKEVLRGAANLITSCRPVINVSAYHRGEDLVEIPFLLKQLDYRTDLYFRKKPYIPAWDTSFISIPKR